MKSFRSANPRRTFALLATIVVVVVVVAVVTPTAILLPRRYREGAVDKARRTPSHPAVARVNLGYAQYQGSLVGSGGGVAQYLGMRYAAPPTGDRRWRAPIEPAVDDSGDQAADAFGPICLGISVPYPNGGAQDEDCLYVNVWAPANATLESKLPVWLFIQGGGYTTNSNANWNGTAVVERSGRNIVLVNFNYRVGLWGFLASERVRADDNGQAQGDLNVGLRDQREAMRWVRRHIAQFGGDPEHVVIHGASAGAGSVALHLLISYAEGERGESESEDGTSDGDSGSSSGSNKENLFVGAMGESPFFPAQPTVADLEWQFDLVLSQTGCSDSSSSSSSQDAMSCLRSKDTALLQQAANTPSPFPGRPGPPTAPLPLFFWTPCTDGLLLPDSPSTLFSQGLFADVPVLMGTTSDEGTVFAPADIASADAMAVFLRSNYPRLTDAQAADGNFSAAYPPEPPLPLHEAWFPSAAAAYGEATFVCPTNSFLSSHTRQRRGNYSKRAWSYRYDVYDAQNAARGLGVPHIWEAWAVFGPDSQQGGAGAGPASYYHEAAGVVPLVMDYWISFVQTLDPSALRTPGAPVWEPWDDAEDEEDEEEKGAGNNGAGRRLLMQVGNFSMETVPGDQRERCDFWAGLAPALQHKRVQ
ncbi:alpha/beta-hydrolase [Daldinia caldariorum]|uniref:alpha/beta-hydrolase n=1 Tax=Daldinia caldariorum TaxID=326644 RepID=UPI00200746B1|nr:alpha/beta-hydrolase [Daldinia caldariorum]KAI1468767.1 alpha/beta-hydrolase [Daldinia caldariorum]